MKKVTPTISQINAVKSEMDINSLKQNEWLAKYQTKNPSAFEVSETIRFGLPQGSIIVSPDGEVLYGWKAIQLSRKQRRQMLKVWVLEGLTKDEIPQVVYLKNMDQKIPLRALVELFLDYKDYLTTNEVGKAWAKTIKGMKTLEKIATLFGSSYGMVYGLIRIYEEAPQYIDLIDKKEMTYTDAEIAVGIRKDDKADGGATVGGDKPTGSAGPVSPGGAVVSGASFGKAGRYRECEPVAGIQVRYVDGRVLDLDLSKGVAGSFDGSALSDRLEYRHVVEVLKDNNGNEVPGAELHTITTGKGAASIHFSIRKPEDLIAKQEKTLATNKEGVKKAA